MAPLGDLTVQLTADITGFAKAFDEALKKVETTSKGLQTMADSMSSVGISLTKSVTAPLVALGGAALITAGQFDSAFDEIRVGTGATGAALAGLQEDFRAVFATTPASFDDVSHAVTVLHQTLELAGKPLQDLSKQVLELSRITGTDLDTNLRAVTVAFNNWQVATADQGSTLDTFFKVSQLTGVSVAELLATVGQFGAQLRLVGLSIGEAAVMVGAMGEAGIDTGKSMAGIVHVSELLYKAGIPLQEGLAQIFARIQELGPGSDAAGYAMQVFGARAGTQLADAITSGRLSVEDMLAVVEGSGETIMGAADATGDWTESLHLMRNQVLLAAEPLSGRLFQAVNDLMPAFESASGALKSFLGLVSQLPGPVLATGAAIGGISATVGPALAAMGTIASGAIAVTDKYKAWKMAAEAAGAAHVGLIANVSALGKSIVAFVPLLAAVAGGLTLIKREADGSAGSIESIANKLTIFGAIGSSAKNAADDWRILREEFGFTGKAADAVSGAFNWLTGETEEVSEEAANAGESFAQIQDGIKLAAGGLGQFGVIADMTGVKLAALTDRTAILYNALKNFGLMAQSVTTPVSAVGTAVGGVAESFESMRAEAVGAGFDLGNLGKSTKDAAAAQDVHENAIQGTIDALTAERDTLGKTTAEILAYKLAHEGATPEVIKAALAILAEVEAFEAATEATKDNADAVADLIADIENQANALGIVTEATIAQRMAELDLTDAQRESIAVLQEKIRQMEFQAEVMKVVEKNNEELAASEREHARAVEEAKDRITDKLQEMITKHLPEWAKGWAGHWQTAKDILTVFGVDVTAFFKGLMSTLNGFLEGLGRSIGEWAGRVTGLFTTTATAATEMATTVATVTASMAAAGGVVGVSGTAGGLVTGAGIPTIGGGSVAGAGGAGGAGAGGLGAAAGNAAGLAIALGAPLVLSFGGEALLNALGRESLQEQYMRMMDQEVRIAEYERNWADMIANSTPFGERILPGGYDITLEMDGYRVGQLVMKRGVDDVRLRTGMEVY